MTRNFLYFSFVKIHGMGLLIKDVISLEGIVHKGRHKNFFFLI